MVLQSGSLVDIMGLTTVGMLKIGIAKQAEGRFCARENSARLAMEDILAVPAVRSVFGSYLCFAFFKSPGLSITWSCGTARKPRLENSLRGSSKEASSNGVASFRLALAVLLI